MVSFRYYLKHTNMRFNKCLVTGNKGYRKVKCYKEVNYLQVGETPSLMEMYMVCRKVYFVV